MTRLPTIGSHLVESHVVLDKEKGIASSKNKWLFTSSFFTGTCLFEFLFSTAARTLAEMFYFFFSQGQISQAKLPLLLLLVSLVPLSNQKVLSFIQRRLPINQLHIRLRQLHINIIRTSTICYPNHQHVVLVCDEYEPKLIS